MNENQTEFYCSLAYDGQLQKAASLPQQIRSNFSDKFFGLYFEIPDPEYDEHDFDVGVVFYGGHNTPVFKHAVLWYLTDQVLRAHGIDINTGQRVCNASLIDGAWQIDPIDEEQIMLDYSLGLSFRDTKDDIDIYLPACKFHCVGEEFETPDESDYDLKQPTRVGVVSQLYFMEIHKQCIGALRLFHADGEIKNPQKYKK